MRRGAVRLVGAVLLTGAASGWAALGSAPAARSATMLGTPGTPHLAVIVMENKNYDHVVGSSYAPYINNTLLPEARSFTDYYSATHPSLPNYLIITSGQDDGCLTDTCAPKSISVNNLFHQIDGASGLSWKAYAENMPSACYGGNYPSSGSVYLARHNPPIYYPDLRSGTGDNTCTTHDVPIPQGAVSSGQLATDIANNTLPSFFMVVPNAYDNMHSVPSPPESNCNFGSQPAYTVADEVCQGDTWLSNVLPKLLSDNGRNDVTALIVFDESDSDNTGGGGHVPLFEVSNAGNVCRGCTDATPVNDYSLADAIENWFGLPTLHATPPGL